MTRKENPHDIIIVKILKAENKERVLKAERQKGQSLIKVGPSELYLGLFNKNFYCQKYLEKCIRSAK